MGLAGRKAVVVGMARSGVAAAELLVRHGASVVATDRRPAAELPPAVAALESRGVRLELGGHRPETFAGAELVVVSPGVPWEMPELELARRSGAEVIGELELGVRHVPGPIVAITGTKGKSTTTAAAGAMLAASGIETRVGGNIGDALTGIVSGATPSTTFVLEVSSFQLESAETLRPRVAVFMNISPDHLDRHPSFEAYAEAKARIFARQTETDVALVNADDAVVMRLADRTRARLVPFSPGDGAGDRAFFRGDEAVLRQGGRERVLFRRSEVLVPGAHLALDMLVAAAAATLMGATPEGISRALAEFRGVEHVLERVAEIDGVTFFNDSKATNVAAARMSLLAFDGPVHVILGGRYKAGDFSELRDVLVDHGSTVLAIGEAKTRIAEALSADVRVVACVDLGDAVRQGHRLARPGDVVLLAPACASFDMFADYAERGRAFKREVMALAARRAGAGA